jgi:succinate dehydrogenase/fumarate reductase flavoprotein subunit
MLDWFERETEVKFVPTLYPDYHPTVDGGVDVGRSVLAAPFDTVKIVPGSLGTFAGLKTDPLTRVLDTRGRPIPGLHAVGNDMASIMGGNYPSGGITLGPGMTFGYVAGRVLAGQPVAGLTTDKEEAA